MTVDEINTQRVRDAQQKRDKRLVERNKQQAQTKLQAYKEAILKATISLIQLKGIQI